MDDQQVNQLEAGIDAHKKSIALLNSLEVLFANKHFQAVVIDGYLKEEAVRLVSLKGDPNQQTPEKQAVIIRDIDGIGSFMNYLRTIKFKGSIAQNSLEADQETLAEMMRNA